jgi:hypothetical protein
MANSCLERILRSTDDHDAMVERLATIDPMRLIQEVERYLVVVEAFRAAECEPTWRRELVPRDAPAARAE